MRAAFEEMNRRRRIKKENIRAATERKLSDTRVRVELSRKRQKVYARGGGVGVAVCCFAIQAAARWSRPNEIQFSVERRCRITLPVLQHYPRSVRKISLNTEMVPLSTVVFSPDDTLAQTRPCQSRQPI